jgi:hypothetical protein
MGKTFADRHYSFERLKLEMWVQRQELFPRSILVWSEKAELPGAMLYTKIGFF